ncbi:phage holin family protein [Phenylobacterium montanum]|uniref:Phage holin family protein n=1 Tax=Phenylobacterium montanum TaxID=2823693 RepID=A0A975G014_9CAUL|nr:phage holin family protein [Caulobacter sp. S6]QUD88057.1 phage holin family protein [Caulobacter sp. S6]
MNTLRQTAPKLLGRIHAFDKYDPDTHGPISPNSEIIVFWVTFSIWFVVLTEKIALPPFNIELCLFEGVACVAMLFWRKLLFIEKKRAIGYFIFAAVLVSEQLFTYFREPISIPAILAAMVYYSVFMFIAPMERPAIFKIMCSFVNVTLFIGFMVYVDWAFNLAHHPIPNFDKILPESFQFLHYVYIQPTHWGSPYTKPNGFFMLEASHTSQFMAMGIVVEFYTRQNLLRLGFLGSALLLTFAGTGFLLLALVIPLMLWRTKISTLLVAVLIVPLILGAALAKGALNDYTRRSSEFTQVGQSGNQRFVWPYQLAWKQLTSTSDFHDSFLGVGASNAADDARLPLVIKGKPNGSPSWGTPTKLIVEYGLFVAVVWSIFFIMILFSSNVPIGILFMLYIQYEFVNGGLLVPFEIFFAYFLGGIYMKPIPNWDLGFGRYGRGRRDWRQYNRSIEAAPIQSGS